MLLLKYGKQNNLAIENKEFTHKFIYGNDVLPVLSRIIYPLILNNLTSEITNTCKILYRAID
jgi:hypothetical protein